MKKSKKRSPAAQPGAARAARVAGEPYYTAQAKEDLAWWRKHQPKLLARIEALIADIRRSPFSGIGKPEPLKHEWQGYWSRRINDGHRLVCRIEAGTVYIAQARYHY
jgi:toxin YoeB